MALGSKLLDPNYRPVSIIQSDKKSSLDVPYYAGKIIKCPVKFTSDILEFLESSDFMDLELRPTQKTIIEDLFYAFHPDGTPKYREAVVISGMRCHGLGTEVLMYDGTLKKVEEILIGDLLMGPDSKPRKVLERHEGSDQLYRVKQSKGIDYVVNSEHELVLVKDEGAAARNPKYSDKYPDKILIPVTEYLAKNKAFKKIYRGYKAEYIEFPKRDVPIDPYLVGLHLGDGFAYGSRLTSMDPEIDEYLQEYCDKNDLSLSRYQKKDTIAIDYSISSPVRGIPRQNKFLNYLHDYDIINNKHIPECYLYNSREVRLQLLAALIDTDGWYNGHNSYEITQVNEVLIKQIKFIADTLGFITNLRSKKSACQVKDFVGNYWRLTIYGDIRSIPVKIERKKWKQNGAYSVIRKARSVIDVVEEGYGKFIGFTVDGDNLYCLSDCTVLKNSGKSANASFVCAGMMHTLLQFDDPAAHFGQMPGYQLTAQFIATSEEQSKQTAYASFESILNGNKWWKKYIGYLQEREIADNKKTSYYRPLSHSIWFKEKNLIIRSLHSNSNSLAGMTSFLVIFDELSRYKVSENEIQGESEASTAQAVYNTAQRSAASLSPYSRVMTVTSPMYETDYGMQLFYQAGTVNVGEFKKEIEFLRRKHRPKNGTNSNIIAYHRSTFEFAPCIINKYGIRTGVDSNDFITYKNTQPLAYKRDFLAIPPGAVNPYMEHPERLELCIVPKKDDFIFVDKIIEDVVVKDGISEIRSYMAKNFCTTRSDKTYRYMISADQGEKSDSFVISMGHIEEYESANKDKVDYKIIIDFIEAWVPSRAEQITVSFSNVSDVIIELNDKFNILQVAYDQWQSSESKQRLFAKGMKTVEMKASLEMYDEFKKLLYTGSIVIPENDDLMTELRQLQLLNNKKIDHPTNGCFTEDTRVLLSNGTTASFKELCNAHPDANEEFMVYSMNSDGNLILAKAKHPRITKEVTELCRITLDTGDVIQSTLEHLFMLRTGKYKEAQNLKINNYLMPCHLFTDPFFNPRVKNVEVVHLNKAINVYDLSVPKFENFVLASNIIVHNSKDLSDSVCRTVNACLRDYLDLSSRGETILPKSISMPTARSIARAQGELLNELRFGNGLLSNASSIFPSSKNGIIVSRNVYGNSKHR